MKITKSVSPAFEDFIFNWDYETYLLIGGYGSGKSYHIAFKIVLKLLEEKRKCLIVRNVFGTIQDSCYDLICEIIDEMGLLTSDVYEYRRSQNKILAKKSPLGFKFKNGSTIIFKGMDNPEKVKSINGVSIVWIEECSEIKYDGYKELLGRIRTPDVSMHFILSCNPIGKDNWVYSHFFSTLDEIGREHKIVDEEEFYKRKTIVKNNTYYHHSVPTDNPWLPKLYLSRLNNLKDYDYYLYQVARLGKFGTSGMRVLPQFRIEWHKKQFNNAISKLGYENMYFGFDFGFEESYNAVISMSVDIEKGYLYIWDEIYMNKVTDDKFANLPEMQELKELLNDMNNMGINKMLVADNEDPKAISYYRQQGFKIRSCKNKFAGSRLSNTRKIKRFKSIMVAPHCINVIRELKDLTYKKDSKGNLIYDQFNIDPHSFSAIWYALDTLTLSDLKNTKEFFSKDGLGKKRRKYVVE